MTVDTQATHSRAMREERRLFVSLKEMYVRMPEMRQLLQVIEQAPCGESELNDVIHNRISALDTAVATDVFKRLAAGMDISLLRQCVEAGVVDQVVSQLFMRYKRALENAQDSVFNGTVGLEGVLSKLTRLRSTIDPYLRAVVAVGNAHAEAFLRGTQESDWESLTRLPGFMATRWNGLAHLLEPLSSLTLASSRTSPFALDICEQISQEAIRRERELTGTVQFMLERRS